MNSSDLAVIGANLFRVHGAFGVKALSSLTPKELGEVKNCIVINISDPKLRSEILRCASGYTRVTVGVDRAFSCVREDATGMLFFLSASLGSIHTPHEAFAKSTIGHSPLKAGFTLEPYHRASNIGTILVRE